MAAQKTPVRLSTVIFGAVTCLLVAIAYAPAIDGGFVLDDRLILLDTDLQWAPGRILTEPSLTAVFGARDASPVYRPIWLAYLTVAQSVFGDDPAGYHLVSCLIHLLNVALLGWLLRLLFPGADRLPIAGAMLVYALHPIHTEVVVWISAVCHLLYTTLLLAGFVVHVLAYPSGIRTPGWRGTALLGSSAGLFAAALLTQEYALIFPVLLAGYHLRWRLPAAERLRLLLHALWPYFLVAALYLSWRAEIMASALPFEVSTDRVLGLPIYLAAYLKSTFIPWPQFVDLYGATSTVFGWRTIGIALLLAAAVSALVLRLKLGLQAGLLPAYWLCVGLAPGLYATFHEVPSFAFRFTYLAAVSVALIMVPILGALGRRSALVPVAIVLALCIVAVPGVRQASAKWQSEYALYVDMLRTQPDNWRIHLYCGLSAGKRGELTASEAHLEAALRLNPDISKAWVGLGNIHWQQGEASVALDHYIRASQLDPTNREACLNIASMLREIAGTADAAERMELAARIRTLGALDC